MFVKIRIHAAFNSKSVLHGFRKTGLQEPRALKAAFPSFYVRVA
jgi:hypothetical protein